MVLLLHSRGIDQELRSLHAGVHVGQLELGILELRQTLMELDTLLRVLDGLLNSALAKAKRLGAARPGQTKAWKKAIVQLTEDSKAIEFFEGMV